MGVTDNIPHFHKWKQSPTHGKPFQQPDQPRSLYECRAKGGVMMNCKNFLLQ